MSAFNEVSFRSKLDKLNDSSQSIQTLSHWIIFYKKPKESAQVWARETLRADPSRRLLFIYLANDVMQNSRRKHTELAAKGVDFVREFSAQLAQVLPETYAAASENTRQKLLRLLSIWEERRVLTAETINALRQNVLNPVGSSTPSNKPSPVSVASEGAKPTSPAKSASSPRGPSPRIKSTSPRAAAGGGVPFKELLESLEEGGLVDELLAERECDVQIEQIEEADVANLEQLQQRQEQATRAITLLKSHRSQLAEELADRRQLILMLAASCEAQHVQCQRLQASLTECEQLASRTEKAASSLNEAREQMAAIAQEAQAAL
eukprot:CAMPEP_0119300912 /NCGR_PEP_ID=MMETSP1333-20130426/2792_1 /TAXON_ID=418940 /ORGANISM="Scyphosphaera apsteinii, Strain RCC1455" /LENGTH=320 /DNA_ID=CAMNT_0007302841 /DNA_START=147 /DNA_END=1109 /DNA_ORIENTATION=+